MSLELTITPGAPLLENGTRVRLIDGVGFNDSDLEYYGIEKNGPLTGVVENIEGDWRHELTGWNLVILDGSDGEKSFLLTSDEVEVIE